jgi:hypothetical protein
VAAGATGSSPIRSKQRRRLCGRSQNTIERFRAATIANSSLWQKAHRDQGLVTQTIRIALTRYS